MNHLNLAEETFVDFILRLTELRITDLNFKKLLLRQLPILVKHGFDVKLLNKSSLEKLGVDRVVGVFAGEVSEYARKYGLKFAVFEKIYAKEAPK